MSFPIRIVPLKHRKKQLYKHQKQYLVVLRPGSNAVFHMIRNQFNQLGSCERRRLTQLSPTDFIWSGWGWPAVNNAWRPTLGKAAIFTWVEPNMIKGLKAPFWLCLEKPLNATAFVIYLIQRIGSTELSSTFDSHMCSFNYLSRPKLSLGSAQVKYGVWPQPCQIGQKPMFYQGIRV